jgi:predicted restriction endonuclease
MTTWGSETWGQGDSKLREARFQLAGYRCEWPQCPKTDDLQLAHLRAKGMGGSPTAKHLDNTACLCRQHHDIFDGRVVTGRSYEVRVLLEAYLQRGETHASYQH